MSKPIRVRVENGRLVGEAPEGMAEGTELECVLPDEGDDLDDEEVAALNKVIDLSLKQAAQGKVVAAEELFKRLAGR